MMLNDEIAHDFYAYASPPPVCYKAPSIPRFNEGHRRVVSRQGRWPVPPLLPFDDSRVSIGAPDAIFALADADFARRGHAIRATSSIILLS